MARALRYAGIDIGTTTGYALVEGDKLVRSGASDFSVKRNQHIGHRGIMFYKFLQSLGRIDEIYYEKIQFTGSRIGGGAWAGDSGELYKGFLMLINMYAAALAIPAIGIWPGTLKKAFTGHGAAQKEDMCARAHEIGWRGGHPGTGQGHDEVDAIALVVTQLRDRYRVEVKI